MYPHKNTATISFHPIAYIKSQASKNYHCSKQACDNLREITQIEGVQGWDLEQLLDGIMGFEWIWVITYFDRAKFSRRKICPPGMDRRVGVLATRSPHRPNPIALSCVQLVSVKGRNLWVRGGDWLNGTPVLDIKPYIDKVDSHQSSKQGWLYERLETREVRWSERAKRQLEMAHQYGLWELSQEVCQNRLATQWKPSTYNRLKKIGEEYVQSWGYWRCFLDIPQNTLEPIWITRLSLDLRGCPDDQIQKMSVCKRAIENIHKA